MSMNNQEEYSFSELFKCPVVQSDILNGKFKKIYPTTKVEDSGLIQFLIENTTDHFLDLSQSYPDIKFNVVNSHGSNLAANAKAGLVNYSIASLFQEVYVLLNSNLTSSLTNTCTYRAMLKVLSGYDQGLKNSYLTMGLYSKGTATKMDLVAVDGANSGLKATSRYIKERKLVKVPDLLHWDLINLDHLLLNRPPFKIILHRQRDSFILIADDVNRDCRVQ